MRPRDSTRCAVAAVAVAIVASASPATAGPEDEAEGAEITIYYPGYFTVAPGAKRQVVARVYFENDGDGRSAGLDACVVLPRGFRDAAVNGRRRKVRVTRGGAKICWYAGALSAGKSARATVRATAPRREGRYETKVRLIAVRSAIETGASQSRGGAVFVER